MLRGGGAVAEKGKSMNLRKTANKLQTALCQQGRQIKINQYQCYSERSGRMVNKFVLQETRQVKDKQKNVTILESFSLADIVKELAKLYAES